MLNLETTPGFSLLDCVNSSDARAERRSPSVSTSGSRDYDRRFNRSRTPGAGAEHRRRLATAADRVCEPDRPVGAADGAEAGDALRAERDASERRAPASASFAAAEPLGRDPRCG